MKKLKRIGKKFKKEIKNKHSPLLADGLPDNVFDVFAEEDYRIPQDITDWAPTNLRNAHAYWASNYVYCMGKVSSLEARLKELKHRRKLEFNDRFLMYKSQRASNEVARMKAELNKDVKHIDEGIQQCDVSLSVFNGLMESCKTYKDLCSRDQSYREREMSNYNERGGQGK